MKKEIAIPLFNASVYIVANESKESAISYLAGKDADHLDIIEKVYDDDCYTGITSSRNDGHIVIIVKLRKNKSKPMPNSVLLGTIAHELVHAAAEVMRFREIKLSQETEEIQSMLVEYIAKEIADELCEG